MQCTPWRYLDNKINNSFWKYSRNEVKCRTHYPDVAANERLRMKLVLEELPLHCLLFVYLFIYFLQIRYVEVWWFEQWKYGWFMVGMWSDKDVYYIYIFIYIYIYTYSIIRFVFIRRRLMAFSTDLAQTAQVMPITMAHKFCWLSNNIKGQLYFCKICR